MGYLFKLIFIFSISVNALSFENPLRELLESVPNKSELTQKHVNFIQEEIKLQSLLIESIEQIKLTNGNFSNITIASEQTRDIILQSSLKKLAFKDEFARQNFIQIFKEVYTVDGIKSSLRELKKITGRFVSWQAKSFVHTARTQGLVYSMVKFISLQLDTTIPFLFLTSGNFAAGGALLVSPVSPVVLFPFKVVKDAYKSAALIKRLGLKEAVKLIKINLKVKESFNANIINQLNLIHARVSNTHYTMRVSNTNIISRMLGTKSSEVNLNFSSLSKVLKEYSKFDELITGLTRSNLPDEIKILTLLTAMENSNNELAKQKFTTHFRASLFRSEGFAIPKEQVKWLLRLAHSKDFETLYLRLNQIPQDLNPQVFDKVWRQYVFPNLAKNIEGGVSKRTYLTFRKIENSYNKNVRKTISHQRTSYLSKGTKIFFTDTIFNAMNKTGACGFIYKANLHKGAL